MVLLRLQERWGCWPAAPVPNRALASRSRGTQIVLQVLERGLGVNWGLRAAGVGRAVKWQGGAPLGTLLQACSAHTSTLSLALALVQLPGPSADPHSPGRSACISASMAKSLRSKVKRHFRTLKR